MLPKILVRKKKLKPLAHVLFLFNLVMSSQSNLIGTQVGNKSVYRVDTRPFLSLSFIGKLKDLAMQMLLLKTSNNRLINVLLRFC